VQAGLKGENMNEFMNLMTLVGFFLLVDQVINIFVQAKKDWRVYEFWAAIAVSITLTVLAEIDMFAIAGFELSVPYVGEVATGIAGSRGANYMHDGFKMVRAIGDKAKNESEIAQLPSTKKAV
jgi:hypothetical protein